MASDESEDDEPGVGDVRTVLAAFILLLSLAIMILLFTTQTALMRSIEFGCAIATFVLSIAILVL